jgi:hypothetical protein
VVWKKCLPRPDPDAFPDDLFPDLTPFCHPVKDNGGTTTPFPLSLGGEKDRRTPPWMVGTAFYFLLFAGTSSEEWV